MPRKKKKSVEPLIDLVNYLQTEKQGVDWNDLQKQDLRVDDFHIVPLSEYSISFKDPVVSNVFVQMDMGYIMGYAFRMIVGNKKSNYYVYKKPIAKMVHWIWRRRD